MKIAIHDFAGHAFTVELAREMARRGHEIDYVYFVGMLGPKGALGRNSDDPPELKFSGIEISDPFAKYSFFKRWLQEREYGRRVRAIIEASSPDVVISGNSPLDAQWAVEKAARVCGASFLYWLQDIQSEAMRVYLPQKHPIIGPVVAAWYTYLERRMLRQSDKIVCIADSFVEFLLGWGIAGSHISVIRNWAPKEEIRPMPKENAWSIKHGLNDKKVFLYAGTMGLKHNPALLAQLAEKYVDDPSVAVVVVSEGLGSEWLQNYRDGKRLDRLIVMPFQPFDRLSEVLGTGDVLISVIEPEAAQFSVPSKILSYMAAGRTLLVAVPSDNLAARIVCESESGIAVAPNDSKSFLESAARLIDDPQLRAAYSAAARHYAETNFDVEKVTDRFLSIIEN